MLKYTLFFLVSVSIISCTNVKKVVYFRGQEDGIYASENAVPEIIIQSNDILSVIVNSLNPEASAVFNTTNNVNVSSTTSAGLTTQASGYLVSPDGFIDLPLIGKIKAIGLTKSQLTEKIINELTSRKLLLGPIVNIRILNFKITVLGEVEHPTALTVPDEKISLLEALGLAGDLTINGRRDNVMIIREEMGKKIITRINLNSKDLFTSPSYYYLKSNDVVYVETTKRKIRNNSNANLWVSVLVSTLSFGIVLLDHISIK